MPTPRVQLDALIIGGGIAGLWTLAALRSSGYSAALLEHRALGAGQTIWSQGIIHGGIKYALTGEASRASKAIAAMPAIWRAALAGRTKDEGVHGVDLSAAPLLTDHQYLWTTPGLVSRIAGVAASKAIRTPVERLERTDFPSALREAPGGVDVYRVDEPVLPGARVLEALRTQTLPSLALARSIDAIDSTPTDVCVLAELEGSPDLVEFHARRLFLCAGAGNESLLELAKLESAGVQMQRRPLHMTLARGRLPLLYGHCLGSSTVPRLTITSIPLDSGEVVWSIGGAPAEEGVPRSREDQIAAVRHEIHSCLPWLDLAHVRWATGRIDRAEGLSPSGSRPDEPVIRDAAPNITVVWPTKLAFAPAVATSILAALTAANINPVRRAAALPDPLMHAPKPAVAQAPWDALLPGEWS